jgi:hypothetical protein
LLFGRFSLKNNKMSGEINVGNNLPFIYKKSTLLRCFLVL